MKIAMSTAMMVPDMKDLFSEDLNDKVPAAGARVEIDQDDLLPGAQQQRSVGKRHGDRRPLQLAPQVTMAVIFARIFLIVLPGGIRRNRLVPKRFGIGPDARLIFDDHDGGRRMLDEDRHDPGRGLRARQRLLYERRHIFNLRAAAHLDAKGNRGDRHAHRPTRRRNRHS